jgi:hypothetical protein
MDHFRAEVVCDAKVTLNLPPRQGLVRQKQRCAQWEPEAHLASIRWVANVAEVQRLGSDHEIDDSVSVVAAASRIFDSLDGDQEVRGSLRKLACL